MKWRLASNEDGVICLRRKPAMKIAAFAHPGFGLTRLHANMGNAQAREAALLVLTLPRHVVEESAK